MVEGGLQVQVEVEVDLPRSALHTRLVEQGAQPLVLLGRKHDGGGVAADGETGERTGLANQRLALEPAEVQRLGRAFGGGDGEARPGREIVEAADRRQGELARELPAAGLRRRKHRRLVEQRPGIDQLAAWLEIQHHRALRQMVEQRRPGRIQVRGVKLDARECGTHPQPGQLVLPLRAHVTPQGVE